MNLDDFDDVENILYSDDDNTEEIEIKNCDDYKEGSLIISNLTKKFNIREIIEINRNFTKWSVKNGSVKSIILLILKTLNKNNILLNKNNYKYIFDNDIIKKYIKYQEFVENTSKIISDTISGWVFVIKLLYNSNNVLSSEDEWITNYISLHRVLYLYTMRILLVNYNNIIKDEKIYIKTSILIPKQTNIVFIILLKLILDNKIKHKNILTMKKYYQIFRNLIKDNEKLITKKLYKQILSIFN